MSEVPTTGGAIEDVTDEQLQQLRQSNAELLRSISDTERERAEAEAAHARAIEYGQLLTENQRLRAQLATAEQVRDHAKATAESDNLVDSIKSQLEDAVRQAEAPAGAVDTNSGYTEPEETLPSAQDRANAESAGEDSAPDPADLRAGATTPTLAETDEQAVATSEPSSPATTDEGDTSPSSPTPTGTDVDTDTPAQVSNFLDSGSSTDQTAEQPTEGTNNEE